MLTALPGRSTLCAEPATLLRDAPHRTWICRLMGPFGGPCTVQLCERSPRSGSLWMTGIRDRRSGCARAAACGWLRDLLRSDCSCSPGVQGYSTAPDRFRPRGPGRARGAELRQRTRPTREIARTNGCVGAAGGRAGLYLAVTNRWRVTDPFSCATVENLSELNSTYTL